MYNFKSFYCIRRSFILILLRSTESESMQRSVNSIALLATGSDVIQQESDTTIDTDCTYIPFVEDVLSSSLADVTINSSWSYVTERDADEEVHINDSKLHILTGEDKLLMFDD
jgi:hypothetical protein